MKNIFLAAFLAVLIILPLRLAWGEDPLYAKVYSNYSRSDYIVGIGETPKTGSSLRDNRVAEVMARRELAAQVRVEVSEVAIDIMCSGGSDQVTGQGDACRDEFSSILETRVSEFIQGSRIVEHGEYEGRVYAVAVMPRKDTAGKLKQEARESAERTKQYIKEAKSGDASATERAREEYKRARALNAQGDAFERARGSANELFVELEKELENLEEH